MLPECRNVGMMETAFQSLNPEGVKYVIPSGFC